MHQLFKNLSILVNLNQLFKYLPVQNPVKLTFRTNVIPLIFNFQLKVGPDKKIHNVVTDETSLIFFFFGQTRSAHFPPLR